MVLQSINRKVIKYGNGPSVIFWKFGTFLSQKYLEVFTLGNQNSRKRSVFKHPAEGWMSFLK